MGPRFTPTGVGTIPRCVPGFHPGAVHPHGRGDNEVHMLPRPIHPGSPPRAWGQSDRTADLSLRLRFTPTGVGTMSQ